MKKASVLAFGSALVDLLCHVPDDFLKTVPGMKGGTELLSPGEMEKLLERLPCECIKVQGGSAANTAVGLANLGNSASFLCKVGKDSNAEFFKNAMESAGVSSAPFKKTDDFPTGRCLSLISPDSERTMRTCMAAAAEMGPGDLNAEDFAGYTHFYVECYSLFNRELLIKSLETARAAGLEVHLDLAAPEIVMGAADILPALIKKYVHAVYANEPEAAALSGCSNPEDALEYIGTLCPLSIVKLGKQGSMLRLRGGEIIRVPARLANAVDTTAAGDLWAAGFLHGYLRGWNLKDCASFGAATSAAVVQVTGSVLSEETWNALRNEAADIDNNKG